jgi:hypothetical protein
MTRASSATASARPASFDAEHTLDRLAALPTDELSAIYRDGRVPDSLAALDGKPVCRMLTIVGGLGRGPAAAAVRRFAASPVFPWAGKTFAAHQADVGTGHNRVRLFGTRDWFPFDTAVAPSAIDGAPCIVLDYDKPENPWFIRQIHDELREVSDRLFLGPAMWKGRASPTLILFFACDLGQ